ncbi:MAG: glycosyltransferase family 4 protein [Agriterribacter sp.]
MAKRKLIIFGGKLNRTGGIETHLFNFCLYTSDVFDIHFIINSLHFNKEKKTLLIQRGVNVYELSSEGNIYKRIKSFKLIISLIYKIKGGDDDVVLYTNAFTSNLIYVIQRTFNFKNWVHHHHSDFSKSLFFSYPYLYKKVFQKARFLILCTDYQLAQYKKMGFSPTAFFLPYCKKENTDIIKQKEFNGVICYLGRVLISKGIDYILNLESSWLLENEIKCYIHGNNELDPGSLYYEKLTKKLPDPFYYFGEYDAENDIKNILDDISITIIPSVGAEGLPLVFTESISRGVPVIAFDGGGLRDFETFHDGIIITKPSPDNLKSAILEMKKRISSNKNLGSDLKKKYFETLDSQITINWWGSTFN